MAFRIGMGYDVHKLSENRRLILGGVEIPFEKGLLGHSDADCLTHAVMDSILGCMGKKDIGNLFPDNDEKFKDISSLLLLEEVAKLLVLENYKIVNIDSVIIAQAPKMSPHTDAMKKNIASILKIPEENINIKATTEEGLGFTGNGEGITCQAVCLAEKFENKARLL